MSAQTIDRAEWLADRLTGIGGSDAGVVAGLSPYKSALELYLEKRGELPADTRDDDERLYWGTVLEEPIARRYVEVTGRKVRRQPMRTCGVHVFMIANVDRQILGDSRGPGVLEVKTTNAFSKVTGLDELPDHYYLQLQHYLAVTGYAWGSFAFLVGGQRFVHFDVERDTPTIEVLIEVEREFWRRVELGDPPPVDGSDATRALLARMHPQDNGASIELSDRDAFLDLLCARAEIDHFTAKKLEAENRIKSEMGDASRAFVPGLGEVTWKTTRPGSRTIWEAVATGLSLLVKPEIYAAHVAHHTTVVPGTRPFRVKLGKEEQTP